jgi:hypothetical protein
VESYSSRPLHDRALQQNEVVPVLGAEEQIEDLVLAATKQNINRALAQQNVPTLDFSAGAKAYKKRHMKRSAGHGFRVAATLVACTLVAVAGVGFYLNNLYSGRALPFSYVGDVSVGGLSEAQIKKVLDDKVNELTVTFVDGGLQKTVSASSFGVKVDTAAVSKRLVTDINPFAFLDRRRVEVPVTINDYQVDGFMRLNIHNSQQKPTDARIDKDTNKIFVKPEGTGFKSDPKFAAHSIKVAFAQLNNAVVNVNAATIKAKVTSNDLQDDIDKANRLLKTNVTIAYGSSVQVVSYNQKLAWLDINSSFNEKDANFTFSRSLIRQYVRDLATKYQYPIKKGTDKNAAVYAVQIENIEEVTDAIFAGLSRGEATAQKFVAVKNSSNWQAAQIVSPNQTALATQNR